MARRSDSLGKGNFVSEWFGGRVYPTVENARLTLADQRSHRCPFLSEATNESKTCVKPKSSLGICTISSSSNGPRQDWLVCPYRALDDKLLDNVVRRLFGIAEKGRVTVVPAPILAVAAERKRFQGALKRGDTCIAYLQDKLGGEISISQTDRSPEVSFDITLVHIFEEKGIVRVGKYGILEVQTMDFHGSYKKVVSNLTDSLRLHEAQFHRTLQANQQWLSQKIEGPNIANVFKRTFYQIMLKFQIAADESCAGCVLALPVSVWDSWQRHLGRPVLEERTDKTFALRGPEFSGKDHTPAWIYLFDIDGASRVSPNRIVLKKIIATDAESLSHYALKVAPEAAVAGVGATDRVVTSIRRRLKTWWPDLGTAPVDIHKGKKS